VSLARVVDEALQELAGEIVTSGADVRAEDLDRLVLAHAPTLTRAVVNLLNNALTYVGEDRHPRVRIHSETVDAGVRLWVEDQGIGIEEEYLERIFGVFERLHPPERFPGTGVGLATVAKAAERMGGSVGVESVSGQGSRFWIELERA
jgi:signal transduction histidine kinase